MATHNVKMPPPPGVHLKPGEELKIDVKPAHVSPMLRAAIAEVVFGYERRMNTKTGDIEWKGQKIEGEDTGWVTVDKLYDWPGDDFLSWRLMLTVCQEHELVFAVSYDPKQTPCMLASFSYRQIDGSLMEAARAKANHLAMAITTAVGGIYKIDFPKFHKLLYPEEWIQTRQ